MNKFFGLLLLALAFIPGGAEAASRFAVCSTTCTWDNTSTAMWAATSGGATGASAPTSADDVTLDANTCVGGTTCTITTFAGTISINTLTMGACTASTSGCILDASANNTNFTCACASNGFNLSGTGVRTLNMGNGTWSVTAGQGRWTLTTATNMTLNAGSSTIAFTSTISNQTRFDGGGKTYNVVTFAGGGDGSISITGGNTFATLTVSNTPARIAMANGVTNTITNFTNITGTASAAVIVESDNPLFGQATISSPNNWTCSFCVFNRMAFTGAGSFTANNSFNAGNTTGITINAPSGGGGGRIIGG